MLLRRQKSKKSKAKMHGIAMISLLILACEIWYVDSLNRRETRSNWMAISQEFVAGDISTLAYPAPMKKIGGKSKLPASSSHLMREEKGGGDTHLFSVNDGELALADGFEYVCSGTSLYASIYVAQLHAKEAK
jgi:hypothetical protein